MKSFEALLNGLFTTDEKRKFLKSIISPLRPSIRINPLKADKKKILNKLQKKGFTFEPIPSCLSGFYVKKMFFDISKTLEHFLGHFYIQSAASMLPSILLNPDRDEIILDIASAPGSKTTHLGELMKNRGAIIANDFSIDRIKALSHNIDRIGLMNCVITKADGGKFGKVFPESFDRVLVDAPCTSLGTLSSHREILSWWHPREIDRFYAIQRKLLISGLKALKPGGILVYSTCTWTIKENEDLVDEILKKYPVDICNAKIDIPHYRGITHFNGQIFSEKLKRAIRLYPHISKTEGFFIVVLRKTDTTGRKKKFHSAREEKFYRPDEAEIHKLTVYLEDNFGIPSKFFENLIFKVKKNEIWMMPPEISRIQGINSLRSGLRLARKQKKGYKLTTNAVQVLGNYVKAQKVELNTIENLKKFLKAEKIKVPGTFKGQVVVVYQDYVLGVGVVKNGILKSQMPRSRRIFEIIE